MTANKTEGFEVGLQKHLWKCELEYRVKAKPTGSTVGWLGPFCGSTQQIAAFLREIGFRIDRIVDEVDCTGHPMQWVETTSGIIVFQNWSTVEGFVARSARASAREDDR